MDDVVARAHARYGPEYPINPDLWFVDDEHCGGRHYLTGKPHRHRGRFAVYRDRENIGLFASKWYLTGDAAPAARAWVDGFLAGNEPRPEDLAGPDIHCLDDDDERWVGPNGIDLTCRARHRGGKSVGRFDVDPALWVELDDGQRRYLCYNPHTHPGRVAVVDAAGDNPLYLSRGDFVAMSTEGRYWLEGYLRGSEPEPHELFGEAIHEAALEDPRWEEWRRALDEFRESGNWTWRDDEDSD